jgi:hypothetical protein
MSNEITTQVSKRELVTYGRKEISLSGWHMDLAEAHLLKHRKLEDPENKKQWCNPNCMAQTLLQRGTENNRKHVRKQVAPLFRFLLQRGFFLVISYDQNDHGKIKEFKLYDEHENDLANARRQLERMYKRKTINEEIWRHALTLLGVGEAR